jgi:hypothetical protein
MFHLPKKLFAVLAPLAVIGALFAVPAMASASELTDSAGAVEVGEEIVGTSTNAVTQTGAGELVCEEVVVHGTVTQNSGGIVKAIGAGGDTATGCTLAGEPTTVSPNLESIELLSPTSGTAKFSFLVAGALPESSTSSTSYTSGATSIHVAGPVTGAVEGSFSGDFSLADGNGAVTVH